MKRIFVLLTAMVFMVGGIFAANYTGTTSNGTADVEVSLALGTTDQTKYYEFGFASAEITEASDFPVDDRQPAVNLTLNNSEGNGAIASNTGESDKLWVYWNIIDENGIDLELVIDEPLVGSKEDNDDVIQWMVSFNNGTPLSVTSPATESSGTPGKVDLKTDATGIDSYELTISTVEGALNGKTADTYTGTLTVRVKSAG